MNSLVFLIKNTGFCGISLITLAIVSLYIFIKNSLYLHWMHRDFRSFFSKIEKRGGKINQAGNESSDNPLLSIIWEVSTTHATHSEDIRAEIAYLFHLHLRRVISSLTALRLISVISPLLGLMGTVLGMVKVFRVVASQSHANPTILAQGIWEAMLTTIMGLIIAIPSLIFFYFLRQKLTGFKIETIEYSYQAIKDNHLQNSKKDSKEKVSKTSGKNDSISTPLQAVEPS